MKFFETSKYYSLKKSTYISLRWIAIIGQLISVNLVYFYFNFKFDFIGCNIVIIFGIISNLYLIYIYKKAAAKLLNYYTYWICCKCEIYRQCWYRN